MLLNAKQRLRATDELEAFTPNTVRKKNSIRDFKLITEEFNSRIVRKKTLLGKVGPLDAFYYTTEFGESNFVLTASGGIVVGYLEFESPEQTRLKNRVKVATLEPKYQGKGYGFLLYELALKKLGSIVSSDDLSIGSSALWAKLCQKYDGFYVALSFPNLKAHRLKPVKYKVVKGITYPCFLVKGKPVSLFDLNNDRNIQTSFPAKKGYYEIKK